MFDFVCGFEFRYGFRGLCWGWFWLCWQWSGGGVVVPLFDVGSGVVVEWLWLFLAVLWLVEWWWRWLWPVERFLWWICFYFILMSSLYYFNQISKNIDPLMLNIL